MYLKQNKVGDRIHMMIMQGYRDKETKTSRSKTVETVGYVDEFLDKYADPVAHFREVARQMTLEEKAQRKVTITLDMNESMEVGTDNVKNLGYAAITKIYHELKLDQYFNNEARNHEFKYSPNSIMTMLVVARLLSPGSKLKAYKEKGRYFERFDFSLVDVYRSLSHFASLELEVQRHINEQIIAFYGPRNTQTIYYDVTNYYFEIDKEDGLRRYGVSKEHRKDPIVQMGLAMDADGIPLHYKLFPGSLPDKSTFRDVIGEVRLKYDTGRIVVVADMGVITGDNIYYLIGGEKLDKTLNGYVLSFSVRGGTKDFKKYVLDRTGYRGRDGKPVKEDADFMIKSEYIAREINVTMDSGKTEIKIVYEKRIVFWAKKYADKAKADRERVILKANAIVNEPGKYRKSTSYGASKYIKNIEFDKKTGEVVTTGKALIFDEAKLKEEEKYDGYYSIVTSEKHMTDEEIIDTYRGMWEIEETFRITKGTLEARPIYVSLHDRINARFLTCFIALTIMRLLQRRTDRRLSSDEIVECLSRINCTHEHENIYLFGYMSETSKIIGEALDIDFSKKRLRLNEIRNIVAETKK